MGFYNDDHPNTRYPQQRARSAWGWTKPSGLVMVHTVESFIDRLGPDTGAENCANYIATRSDAGGYHELIDSDSFVQMSADGMMTWHTAAAKINGPGWGISAACRATDWDPDDDWTRRTIATMGARIRAFWERQGINPATAARWLTMEQAHRFEIGLCHHGVAQPADRSDAWVRHPQRARLDQMLLDAIGGTQQPAKEWDEMASKEEIKEAMREVLAEDSVKAGLATKTREEINGWLDAQRAAAGQPKGNGINLDDVVDHTAQRVMSSDQQPNIGDVLNEIRGNPTAP